MAVAAWIPLRSDLLISWNSLENLQGSQRSQIEGMQSADASMLAKGEQGVVHTPAVKEINVCCCDLSWHKRKFTAALRTQFRFQCVRKTTKSVRHEAKNSECFSPAT